MIGIRLYAGAMAVKALGAVIALGCAILALSVGSTATAQRAQTAVRQPRPAVVTGSGSRVFAVKLYRKSPLVVTGSHSGSANFIVELVPRYGSSELLFNAIGHFFGQTAWAEARAGGYRVKVEADGRWKLIFGQPAPGRKAKTIPGTVTGRGARVIRMRSHRSLQPIITARHRGHSNFIVDLIGYGDTSGTELLFNEIGNFRGQTLLNNLPRGNYLLHVNADGTWSVKFTP